MPSPRPSRVIPVFAVFPPRTLMLDLAGPLEVIRRANAEQADVRFVVQHVGPRRQVMTSIGVLASAIAPLPAVLPDDAMILISGNVDALSLAPDADAARDHRDEAAIVAWLGTAVRPSHT
ncbi:MAG: GlxA family transcriptional regulator, partial [Myxococcales bacterium]|nr:GlxA family transcriptional regulator [Myxococcales bacterium]